MYIIFSVEHVFVYNLCRSSHGEELQQEQQTGWPWNGGALGIRGVVRWGEQDRVSEREEPGHPGSQVHPQSHIRLRHESADGGRLRQLHVETGRVLQGEHGEDSGVREVHRAL